MGRILQIDEDYLKELLDYNSRSLCGKLLKRFEISDNLSVIKAQVKELVYEEARSLRDLFHAHNRGLEITQFNFRKPNRDATS